MKPTPRRGGYFKARSALWMKAHTEARWTTENPAPKWWAELDAAWCVDAGVLPSIRDYANFLGWKKGAVEGLLRDVYDDIERWTADKTRTKSGQQEDRERTESGQPAEVESQQPPHKVDSGRTVAGQSPDASRARSSKQPQPQTSSSDFRTDTSPPPAAPLFAQPPAPEVSPPAAPKPKPPPADEAEALAVWMAWKETHRSCKATPPADVARLIRAALKEHGAETVIAVVRWTQTADHSRARYLRGERNGEIVPKEAYGLDTIMRHVGSYDALRVADEEAPAASPRMSALPPGMKPRAVVVLDAETGRPVAPEPEPRKGGKPDLFDMAGWLKIIDTTTEEEEDHAESI